MRAAGGWSAPEPSVRRIVSEGSVVSNSLARLYPATLPVAALGTSTRTYLKDAARRLEQRGSVPSPEGSVITVAPTGDRPNLGTVPAHSPHPATNAVRAAGLGHCAKCF